MSKVSLDKYLERRRDDIIEHCTSCGNCVANCEINRFTALKDADPAQLVEAMVEYIKSGKYEQIVYDYAFQCINCLECTIHCPEGIEASAIPVLVKARLVKEGHEAPPMFKMAQPCQKYSVQSILGALQTAPAEKWWLEEAPENPESHDIVLFLGCNEMSFPSAMAATRDVLTHMGVDFVSVGGGKDLCCGAIHLNTGETSAADEMGRRLVESLDRFHPKTVVFTCPTCVYMVHKTLEGEKTVADKYQHLSRFLADRLDGIQFKQPLSGNFTVQDPCFTARGLGDYDSPRKVLAAIEGLTLVEMEHNHENALCCGATAVANNPPDVAEAFIGGRLQEAREAGAKTVVNVCIGCQMAFFGYEKEFGLCARSFSEVVAEAMGLELQPDKMKQFRDLGDHALILEAAREKFEAGGYNSDEISAVLPFLFRAE